MPRDQRAYLADILESCDAIKTATLNFNLQEYQRSRLVRSSVEREFIIIGEAMAALARIAPEIFDSSRALNSALCTYLFLAVPVLPARLATTATSSTGSTGFPT